VFPGLIEVFGCMLAKKFEGDLGRGMYMSLKLDGLRAVYKDGNLYTRNGHVIQGMSHITSQLKNHCPLDGELTIPGQHFQVASGKVRGHADCPEVYFNVFDMPFTSHPFSERLGYLEAINWGGHDQIKLVKHSFVTSLDKVQRNMDKAIAAGYEGLVLKTPDHIYQTKRSGDWCKIKLVESEDLPVIGTFAGEGKYTGMLGGLIVERANGVHVRVGGGLSDSQRAQDPADFIGLTAEVLYHEETPDGSLRHPRLKTFRYDK
jgi:DNA ligase-1